MRFVAAFSMITLLSIAACGGDDGTSEPDATTAPPSTVATTAPTGTEVAIVDVIEHFEYYNPCQNSSIEIDGITYYAVPDQMGDSEGDYPEIDESRYPLPDEPQGFARIAPPGPGDDVGTMVVYDDGTARYESDSGMVSWFTDEELTYNWEC